MKTFFSATFSFSISTCLSMLSFDFPILTSVFEFIFRLPEKDAILRRELHVLKWKICIRITLEMMIMNDDKVSQIYFKTCKEPINQI